MSASLVRRVFAPGLGLLTVCALASPTLRGQSFQANNLPGVSGELRAADIDGDGRDDVGVETAGSLRVFRTTEPGGFAEWSLPALPAIDGFELGDMNADGQADAVLNHFFDDQLRVLLAGAGAFSDHASVITEDGPTRTSLADVDLDGDLDVIAFCSLDTRIPVHLNDGSGQLPKTAYVGQIPSLSAAGAVGDIDADGLPEVISGTTFLSQELRLFPNEGGASWGPAAVIGNLVSGDFQTLKVHDLDDDGLGDVIVVRTSRLEVHRADGLGSVEPPVDVLLGGAIHDVALDDFDEDGHGDILWSFAADAPLGLSRGLGGLAFDAHTTWGSVVPSGSVVSVDLDADGDRDVVVTQGFPHGLGVLRGQTDGLFAAPFGGSDVADLTLVDMDGDGQRDLVSVQTGSDRVSVHRARGDGFFDLPVGQTIAEPLGVAAGDLDGDGAADVLVTRQEGPGGVISVFTGLGDGSVAASPGETFEGDLPARPTLGDVDGDGDLDVALANRAHVAASVLLNDGTGAFLQGTQHPHAGFGRDVALGDFDEDGVLDLFALWFTQSGGAHLHWRAGTGSNGVFGPAIDLSDDGQVASLHLADVDGDGHLDAAVTRTNAGQGGVRVVFGDGAGGHTPAPWIATGDLALDVSSGDFDGDGDEDLFVTRAGDEGPAGVAVLTNAGGGVLFVSEHVDGYRDARVLVAGDLDGDAHVDLTLGHDQLGGLNVLFSRLGPWQALGEGLAGAAGIPRQRGFGPLQANTDFSIELTDGVPSGTAFWVLSPVEIHAQFKGGVLVPSPDVVLALPLDGLGELMFTSTWPDVGTGFSVAFQFWLPDLGGPVGFSASNALRAVLL